jgi:cytochrome c-type biogenesis protein CcmH
VRAWIAAVVTLIALVVTAVAAADCTKTSVADLEDEVMCPVCGTSLGLAREAPLARRERAYIARLVASCRSKDEIKAALVDEFGDNVLALPSKDGFNLSACVAPLLAMLLAGAAIVVALARWRRAGASASAHRAALGSPSLLDPTDAMRLDEQLRHEEH